MFPCFKQLNFRNSEQKPVPVPLSLPLTLILTLVRSVSVCPGRCGAGFNLQAAHPAGTNRPSRGSLTLHPHNNPAPTLTIKQEGLYPWCDTALALLRVLTVERKRG